MKHKLLLLLMIAVAVTIASPAIAETAPLSPQMAVVAQDAPVARVNVAVENVAIVATGNLAPEWVQVAVASVAQNVADSAVLNAIAQNVAIAPNIALVISEQNVVAVANNHFKKTSQVNVVNDANTTNPAENDIGGNIENDSWVEFTIPNNDIGKMDERSGQKIDTAPNITDVIRMNGTAYNTSENTGGLKTAYGGNHHKAVTLKLPHDAPASTWTTTPLIT